MRGSVERRGEAAASGTRLVEWPTWALVVAIYGGWLALTWWWHALPTWALVPLAAWLCAWHMSLQHELIHGHPTRNEALNAALGAPPLNLWLPYALYRDEHRRHHRDAHLTDPLEDPESAYLSAERWAELGAVRRWLHVAGNTFFGRVLLGPFRAAGLFWLRQARQAGGGAPWRVWAGHAALVCLVLGWVCGVCHVGLAAYLACLVYPGTALTMIRSLAEHRAAEAPADRTAIVERAGLLGLLFLNNNLHVLHHECPGVAWYALPRAWRLRRDGLLAGRRGPVYRSYLQVALAYAVSPHHAGPHPVARGRRA